MSYQVIGELFICEHDAFRLYVALKQDYLEYQRKIE